MNKLSFADFYTVVWSMVPQVWKDADDNYGKSLQILLYTMSQHMYYYFYSKIVHMEELFDPDRCPEKYLKFLAGMVGWNLIGADPDSWREQIKAAPLLYKIKGTKRGILLAEKLIGYSVFMSELYRDHIGDAVPKERIFNNTPDSVKIKPWFRKTLTSVEGELLGGQAESDQFDSFNTTAFVKLDAFGQVIRPRLLSNTRKITFTNLSTTELYNNITGENSIARYAKLPRMNVVLKYEHDLGEELADGSIRQNNFKGALDLLLQFKPFHVHIEGLEVRYSLSEYVFDQTNMDSETLNVHEEMLSAVHLDLPRAENTITFSANPAVEMSQAINETPVSPLENRGVISSIYKVIDLNTLSTPTVETSLYNVAKKSLPTKTTTTNILAVGDVITNRDEYIASLVPPNLTPTVTITETAAPQIAVHPVDSYYYYGYESLGVQLSCVISTTSLDTLTIIWNKDGVFFWQDTSSGDKKISTLNIGSSELTGSHIYTVIASNTHGSASSSANVAGKAVPVHSILKYDLSNILVEPILDFKSMLSSQSEDTEVTFESTTLTPDFNKIQIGHTGSGVLPDSYSLGVATAIVNTTTSLVPYRSSVQTIYDTQNISSIISRPWDLNDLNLAMSAFSMTNLQLFDYVYYNSVAVLLEYRSGLTHTYSILSPNIDYYFDNNQNITLNSATIATKFGSPDNYDFLINNSKLHVVYLTRTTYNDETMVGIQSRGFRYKTRINTKFSRQFLIDSLPQESLTRLMPTQIVSVDGDGKTKQKTVIGTKRFKESIDIYNRSSLKNATIDNYTVVNKDPLNRIDQSKWTVYSPEYSDLFLGDQKITNNWWGNYYQAKFPDVSPGNPAFLPYDDVDKSEAAQLKNAYSNQWISALRYLNLSDPRHFLATRNPDTVRTGIWKRNSCKFVSIPFIRSRRDALQVFRRDNPTFTRSEESTDYPIDTNAPFRLDNYKYILPDGTDVSLSYFTPGFSETARVDVTMDRVLGQKAVLTTTGYGLTFPASDTYYNNYSSDVEPAVYFKYNVANEPVIKSSLYAGNIPVSRDPSQFTGITDGLDQLNLLVTGLQTIKDTFVVSIPTTEFILSKTDLFVSWFENNTGNGVSFGYYAPSGLNAIPNILVTVNGIVFNYGTTWTMIFDKLKTLSILTSLQVGDIVTVEYQILPGESALSTAPPEPQIAHILNKSLSPTDISVIAQGNRYIFDLPTITNIPCISWYSSVTQAYINSGSTPIQYQPLALYEEAEPNMLIKVNGIVINYKRDWQILLKKEVGVTVAAIAISPTMSLTLRTNDSITVEYFSTN